MPPFKRKSLQEEEESYTQDSHLQSVRASHDDGRASSSSIQIPGFRKNKSLSNRMIPRKAPETTSEEGDDHLDHRDHDHSDDNMSVAGKSDGISVAHSVMSIKSFRSSKELSLEEAAMVSNAITSMTGCKRPFKKSTQIVQEFIESFGEDIESIQIDMQSAQSEHSEDEIYQEEHDANHQHAIDTEGYTDQIAGNGERCGDQNDESIDRNGKATDEYIGWNDEEHAEWKAAKHADGNGEAYGDWIPKRRETQHQHYGRDDNLHYGVHHYWNAERQSRNVASRTYRNGPCNNKPQGFRTADEWYRNVGRFRHDARESSKNARVCRDTEESPNLREPSSPGREFESRHQTEVDSGEDVGQDSEYAGKDVGTGSETSKDSNPNNVESIGREEAGYSENENADVVDDAVTDEQVVDVAQSTGDYISALQQGYAEEDARRVSTAEASEEEEQNVFGTDGFDGAATENHGEVDADVFADPQSYGEEDSSPAQSDHDKGAGAQGSGVSSKIGEGPERSRGIFETDEEKVPDNIAISTILSAGMQGGFPTVAPLDGVRHGFPIPIDYFSRTTATTDGAEFQSALEMLGEDEPTGQEPVEAATDGDQPAQPAETTEPDNDTNEPDIDGDEFKSIITGSGTLGNSTSIKVSNQATGSQQLQGAQRKGGTGSRPLSLSQKISGSQEFEVSQQMGSQKLGSLSQGSQKLGSQPLVSQMLGSQSLASQSVSSQKLAAQQLATTESVTHGVKASGSAPPSKQASAEIPSKRPSAEKPLAIEPTAELIPAAGEASDVVDKEVSEPVEDATPAEGAERRASQIHDLQMQQQEHRKNVLDPSDRHFTEGQAEYQQEQDKEIIRSQIPANLPSTIEFPVTSSGLLSTRDPSGNSPLGNSGNLTGTMMSASMLEKSGKSPLSKSRKSVDKSATGIMPMSKFAKSFSAIFANAVPETPMQQILANLAESYPGKTDADEVEAFRNQTDAVTHDAMRTGAHTDRFQDNIGSRTETSDDTKSTVNHSNTGGRSPTTRPHKTGLGRHDVKRSVIPRNIDALDAGFDIGFGDAVMRPSYDSRLQKLYMGGYCSGNPFSLPIRTPKTADQGNDSDDIAQADGQMMDRTFPKGPGTMHLQENKKSHSPDRNISPDERISPDRSPDVKVMSPDGAGNVVGQGSTIGMSNKMSAAYFADEQAAQQTAETQELQQLLQSLTNDTNLNDPQSVMLKLVQINELQQKLEAQLMGGVGLKGGSGDGMQQATHPSMQQSIQTVQEQGVFQQSPSPAVFVPRSDPANHMRNSPNYHDSISNYFKPYNSLDQFPATMSALINDLPPTDQRSTEAPLQDLVATDFTSDLYGDAAKLKLPLRRTSLDELPQASAVVESQAVPVEPGQSPSVTMSPGMNLVSPGVPPVHDPNFLNAEGHHGPLLHVPGGQQGGQHGSIRHLPHNIVIGDHTAHEYKPSERHVCPKSWPEGWSSNLTMAYGDNGENIVKNVRDGDIPFPKDHELYLTAANYQSGLVEKPRFYKKLPKSSAQSLELSDQYLKDHLVEGKKSHELHVGSNWTGQEHSSRPKTEKSDGEILVDADLGLKFSTVNKDRPALDYRLDRHLEQAFREKKIEMELLKAFEGLRRLDYTKPIRGLPGIPKLQCALSELELMSRRALNVGEPDPQEQTQFSLYLNALCTVNQDTDMINDRCSILEEKIKNLEPLYAKNGLNTSKIRKVDSISRELDKGLETLNSCDKILRGVLLPLLEEKSRKLGGNHCLTPAEQTVKTYLQGMETIEQELYGKMSEKDWELQFLKPYRDQKMSIVSEMAKHLVCSDHFTDMELNMKAGVGDGNGAGATTGADGGDGAGATTRADGGDGAGATAGAGEGTGVSMVSLNPGGGTANARGHAVTAGNPDGIPSTGAKFHDKVEIPKRGILRNANVHTIMLNTAMENRMIINQNSLGKNSITCRELDDLPTLAECLPLLCKSRAQHLHPGRKKPILNPQMYAKERAEKLIHYLSSKVPKCNLTEHETTRNFAGKDDVKTDMKLANHGLLTAHDLTCLPSVEFDTFLEKAQNYAKTDSINAYLPLAVEGKRMLSCLKEFKEKSKLIDKVQVSGKEGYQDWCNRLDRDRVLLKTPKDLLKGRAIDDVILEADEKIAPGMRYCNVLKEINMPDTSLNHRSIPQQHGVKHDLSEHGVILRNQILSERDAFELTEAMNQRELLERKGIVEAPAQYWKARSLLDSYIALMKKEHRQTSRLNRERTEKLEAEEGRARQIKEQYEATVKAWKNHTKSIAERGGLTAIEVMDAQGDGKDATNIGKFKKGKKDPSILFGAAADLLLGKGNRYNKGTHLNGSDLSYNYSTDYFQAGPGVEHYNDSSPHTYHPERSYSANPILDRKNREQLEREKLERIEIRKSFDPKTAAKMDRSPEFYKNHDYSGPTKSNFITRVRSHSNRSRVESRRQSKSQSKSGSAKLRGVHVTTTSSQGSRSPTDGAGSSLGGSNDRVKSISKGSNSANKFSKFLDPVRTIHKHHSNDPRLTLHKIWLDRLCGMQSDNRWTISDEPESIKYDHLVDIMARSVEELIDIRARANVQKSGKDMHPHHQLNTTSMNPLAIYNENVLLPPSQAFSSTAKGFEGDQNDDNDGPNLPMSHTNLNYAEDPHYHSMNGVRKADKSQSDHFKHHLMRREAKRTQGKTIDTKAAAENMALKLDKEQQLKAKQREEDQIPYASLKVANLRPHPDMVKGGVSVHTKSNHEQSNKSYHAQNSDISQDLHTMKKASHDVTRSWVQKEFKDEYPTNRTAWMQADANLDRGLNVETNVESSFDGYYGIGEKEAQFIDRALGRCKLMENPNVLHRPSYELMAHKRSDKLVKTNKPDKMRTHH